MRNPQLENAALKKDIIYNSLTKHLAINLTKGMEDVRHLQRNYKTLLREIRGPED